MTTEHAFIDLLRTIASAPAARGLADDAAVLDIGGARLVLTSDTMVETVHFLPDDPPASIGWKLAAVNLSDLAAKGARPVACLMNYALSSDAAWDMAFLEGLRDCLDCVAMPLVGGDTVAMPQGAPRSFTLTAIGEAGATVPSRAGAMPGDALYLTGPVGDAGAGLALLQAGRHEPAALVAAYRRPVPRLAEGQALAPHVHAMMDVSDGLLIDAASMAAASRVAIRIDCIPLSETLIAQDGAGIETRIRAAQAGDDYQLLFAAPADAALPVPALRIGEVLPGDGLSLSLDGAPVPLPDRLGYEHRPGA